MYVATAEGAGRERGQVVGMLGAVVVSVMMRQNGHLCRQLPSSFPCNLRLWGPLREPESFDAYWRLVSEVSPRSLLAI